MYTTPPTSPKAVLTVGEFCETCSIGRTSFYAGVQAGLIKVLKFGTRTLVPASEVAAFIDRLSGLAGEGR